MPSPNPSQVIFDAISGLTGGLIVDLQTLVIGALVVSFIVAGFDLLLSALGAVFERRSQDHNFDKSRMYFVERNRHERGTPEYDRLNLLYRRSLRKSI